jgi:hypothetical protein
VDSTLEELDVRALASAVLPEAPSHPTSPLEIPRATRVAVIEARIIESILPQTVDSPTALLQLYA